MAAPKPFFNPVKFSSSGLPVLGENEVIYLNAQACLLTTHPSEGFGTLSLTDRRLLFSSDKTQLQGNLELIISQSQPSKRFAFSRSTRIIVTINPVLQPPFEFVLKFESHSDAEQFTSAFQTSLDRKAWMNLEPKHEKTAITQMRTAGAKGVGVSAILKQHENEKRETKNLASDSFQDMEALFQKANDVVQIISKYQAQISENEVSRTTLTTSQGSTGEDEAQKMRDMLMTIGIRSPVTKATAGGGKNIYHINLLKELADFLNKGNYFVKYNGMITMLDIYCIWNRARGIEMISPDDLIDCTSLLIGDSQLSTNLNISLREFESGLIVLQSNDYGDIAMCEKLKTLSIEKGCIHSFQISKAFNIPLTISNEYIKIAELNGYLCRDEYKEVISYYPNLFNEFYSRSCGGR